MGRVLLCTGKYAQVPYHFNKASINIYCVEELCYLFVSNPFVIDMDIMDKRLVEWLEKECELQELSRQLMTLLRRGCQLSTYVSAVIDYVNYCTPEDKHKIEEVLQTNVGLSQFERRKTKGDFFVKNKDYRLAMNEYDALLQELPEAQQELRAMIFHNLGVVYTRLFLYEDAARNFKKSYDLSENEVSGISYLQAMRQFMREEDYIAFMSDHGAYYLLSMQVEKQMSQMKESFQTTEKYLMMSALGLYKEEGNRAGYYEQINKIITNLKNDYRESVAE